MLCPNCSDQTLKSVNTASGQIHVCPTCGSVFAPWSMLARMTSEPPKFLVAINGLLTFRLPTGRICPQCGKNLEQGRMPGTGVILMVCSTCHSIFADLETLQRADGALAHALSVHLGMASPAPAAPEPSLEISPPPAPEAPKSLENRPAYTPPQPMFQAPPVDHSLLADRLAGEIKSIKESIEKTLRDKLSTKDTEYKQRVDSLEKINADLEKQRLELENQLSVNKGHLEASEKMQFSLQEQSRKSQTHFDAQLKDQLAAMESEYGHQLEQQQKNLIDLQNRTAEQEKQIQALVIQLQSAQAFNDQSSREKLTAQEKGHAQRMDELLAKIAHLERVRGEQEKSIQELNRRLTETPPPTQGPVVPGPVMTPPPVVVKTEPAAPVPMTAKPAAIKPTFVRPPAPKKPSFFKEIFDAMKSAWKPSVTRSVGRPAEQSSWPTTRKPIEVAAKPKPAAAPSPALPKKPKKPINWQDFNLGWAPRVAPILVFLTVNAISFEGYGYALAWGIIAGCACYAFRLLKMYPAKNFMEMTVTELTELVVVKAWQGVPVTLHGHLTQTEGKPVLAFEDASGKILLNQLRTMELLPRVFGLALSQLPGGDFTLKGWLRNAGTLFVEVSEARNEKVRRTSLVKTLRWTFTVLIALIAGAYLLTSGIDAG